MEISHQDPTWVPAPRVHHPPTPNPHGSAPTPWCRGTNPSVCPWRLFGTLPRGTQILPALVGGTWQGTGCCPQHEDTCPCRCHRALSPPRAPQEWPEPPAERAELTFGSAARCPPAASGDRAAVVVASPPPCCPPQTSQMLGGATPALVRALLDPPTLLLLRWLGWLSREGLGGREGSGEGRREGAGSGISPSPAPRAGNKGAIELQPLWSVKQKPLVSPPVPLMCLPRWDGDYSCPAARAPLPARHGAGTNPAMSLRHGARSSHPAPALPPCEPPKFRGLRAVPSRAQRREEPRSAPRIPLL